MMPTCQSPIPDGTLLDYWARDLADGHETDRVEEHLFACGDCSARLHRVAALGPGLATLVRQGRVSGIVSRALLNRMQRDGIHVRMYLAHAGRDRAVCRLSRRRSRCRRPASRLLRRGCRGTVGDGARRLAKRRDRRRARIRAGRRGALGHACRRRPSDAIHAAAALALVRRRHARRTR